MRILVLYNPISGSGRAAAGGKEIAEAMRRAGHEVSLLPTRMESSQRWLDEALDGIELLVIAGGDGAVRLAAPAAAQAGAPIYHFPFGTENLFAREFGMNRNAATLLRAIERFEIINVDMGIANGRAFLLMVSIGFDAEVVHDLAGRRGESISHFSYIRPILAQLRRWRPGNLDVMVDGQRINPDGPGFVVVANCRQYGWHLNPAGRASMADGQLDVVYFPTRSRRELLGWAWRCYRQRQERDPRLIYRLGRTVTISSDALHRYQLDGDPPGMARECDDGQSRTVDEPAALSLVISIQPGALGVLVP